MVGLEAIVVVEERDPPAARGVESGVGCRGALQRGVACDQAQRVRSARRRHGGMRVPDGRDDQDFDRRTDLRSKGR